MPEPYSAEWHEQNVDRLAGELAEAMSDWYSRDREDARAMRSVAGRLSVISRSLSAEVHALGQLAYAEAVR